MKKVILAALTAKFGSIRQAQAMMQVADATPNPEMAIEIMLDVWEPVKILKLSSDPGRDGKRTFVSVDFWEQKVTFTCMRPKMVTRYFPKDTDDQIFFHFVKDPLPGVETPEEVEGEFIWAEFPTSEFETCEDTCSIREWTSNQYDPAYEDIY